MKGETETTDRNSTWPHAMQRVMLQLLRCTCSVPATLGHEGIGGTGTRDETATKKIPDLSLSRFENRNGNQIVRKAGQPLGGTGSSAEVGDECGDTFTCGLVWGEAALNFQSFRKVSYILLLGGGF
ncbi:hypothetical protein MRB53_020980 [Persea americana]|uniref:Uncharacterized protein n=1 Tax=Persea americana TaxID=3435 RepID=A0ACC2L3S1_PERAE|nr:hypothetical protein MRB53_020980 [Persea americana]